MMGNQFNEIMQKLRAQRVRARRYTAMLLVLAMLTSLSVSWRLHQVGTALTTDNEYSCGMEEHVHTDECYTEELVCGYEEGQPEDPDSAFSVDSEPTTEEPEAEPEEPEPEEIEPEVHHHTADCYETVLVEHKELTCGQEEHTHDDTCPVDPDTGDFLCGYEEHTHTDDCYTTETETEEKLVCGYEEGEVLSDGTAADDGIAALEDTNTATSVAEDDSSSEAVSEPVLHHHTEACYEKVLTCTIPEHTHTLECLADYSADVETDDDWEKYSVGLSDHWNEALLTVAKEQLGYKESEKNFQTDEALGDIIDVHHYTRYGAFYGNPYADWDVAFIAFCQHYAGIPKTEIPQRLGLEALRADMDAMGFAYLTEGEDAAYEAIPGDVVTYNKNGTADDETIGIVETVGDDSLTVISGAVEGAVAEVTVPFTDVTSTILVDQAYSDYVGEPDDPDADYDDEIAVQPADEKGAAAVYASEDDIFNINPPAVNLNDSKVQYDLGLTFTLENKPDGKDWKQIPADSTIQEGDEVRLVLHMKSVPENTFSDATNGNKAYYKLPYKLAEPLTDKPIYKEGSTTEVIGHLNVNPEGLAIITFDKVLGFDYKDRFTATINVSGYIVAGGTGTTEDFSLSDGTHFTLKKKSDIKTEKSAAAEVVEKGDKTYFKYTVKVSSQNGTAGQPVTIEDKITNLYNLNGSYDKTSFTLTKDGADVMPTGSPKFADDGKSFKIENLAALGQDEYYELTYLYEVNGANNFTTEKWGTVDNTATATSGENTSPAVEKKSLSSDDITVEKTGGIGGYGNDQAVGKITWTVTINNPNGRDLKGYVVDDDLKTNGITIRVRDKIKIQEWNGWTFEDFKVKGGQQYGTIKDGHTGFTYTFPEGSTGTKYQFIYYTTMPDGTDGIKDVKNEVDVKKGEKKDHAEATAQGVVRTRNLLKNSSGKLETVSAGKMQEKKWNIAVRTDASVGKKSSFTVTDTFLTPTIDGNTASTLKHYAVKSKLEQELKNSIRFYWVRGEESGKALYSDLTGSEFAGVKIDIAYYNADGNAVTDDNDEVTSFKITVDWTNATGKNENLVITQLNAESYSSYVEDVSSLEAGKTLTVTNQIEYEGDHVSANSSYTKPAAGKAELKKYACDNAYHGFSENATVEYGKIIWFKLILKNVTDDTVTVTDTLPKGLKYENFVASNDTNWMKPYYVGFSKSTESGVDAGTSLFPLSGQSHTDDDSRQGKGYLTVSYTPYQKNQEQTLTFTLNNLTEAQKNNPEGYNIAIIFGVRVDDDRWEDIHFTQDTYTNTAKWDKEAKAKTADVTVQRTNFGLWKTAQRSSDQNAATYTVEINKENKQWLSTPGSELELHDTLTIPAEIDAEINRQSVKLEKYVNGALTDVTTTDLRRFTLEPMQIDGTNKVYKMTFTVPDGCYYKLTYEYRFLVGSSLGTQQFEISNKVDMFGHGETNSDYRYHYVEGGGTASQKNTNTLQLLKVERNKYYNTLQGATFKLSKWGGTGWSEVKADCTTDANGQILFRYAESVDADVVKVERGVLYKLKEIAPPNGYIGDSTPHYFLMLNANQTKDDAAITSVVRNSGVAESQITFVAANQTEQMYVENTAKQITIRKVWQDANGKQESNVPHEDITVKLTRTDKATGLEDTSWSKKITLSSDNDWTYIYPDSSKNDDPLEDGYTYAVEEEKEPDGYNVSYTDSKGTERHTGLTSGDSVTITNMKKTNWLIVEKKWLAEGGTTTLTDLPEDTSITLKLYKVDGTDPVQTKTLTKGDGNNWKWKVTNLDPSAKYYVVEEPTVKGFEVSYSHSVTRPASPGDTVIVTNTQKSTKTTLEVVKKWLNTDGMELEDNLPVGGIIVQLYKLNVETGKLEEVGGKTLPLNESNGWTGMFTDLEPDGQYTVKEVSVPDGYTVSYSVNEDEAVVPGATITVTNRKNAPGYELPATGSTGTAPYTTAGAVLMAAALVGGYRRKRRQERRGE